MEILNELVSKLEGAFHDRLVAVILYGSAATGDHDATFSDYNTLCVVKRVSPEELALAEPVWKWWRAAGNPSPLLLTEEEVVHSADSFPLEFSDMKERRRLLYGPDVIENLRVEAADHRTILERELRVNLLRLRQKAASVLSDPAALLRLCADSVSTFCVLGRHMLRAGGAAEPPFRRREVVQAMAAAARVDAAPLNELLDIRQGRPPISEPVALLAAYLAAIESMIRYVDTL